MALQAYLAGAVHDGCHLHPHHALLVEDRQIVSVVPNSEIPEGCETSGDGSGYLAPGFVDLQVNGGGGVMLNDDPSVDTLRTIATAHARLGTAAFLPTLISDTRQQTRAAIDATVAAVSQGVPGVAGLHLEGPHLSISRKGAHDPAFIRPMDQQDLQMIVEAAASLPSLMITVAAETVEPDQIAAMVAAGVVVSLGHSDAGYDTCLRAIEAGASCATHLFNAMSQMVNRDPGLVGAALDQGAMHAGLIADGVHVHPACIAASLRAKRGPGGIFLVTDAMATAGTDIGFFYLNGRRIERRNGRLTLADGTLAGADLDMATAIGVLVGRAGVPVEDALRMATSGPAEVVGRDDLGRLGRGGRADFVRLAADLSLQGCWQGGRRVS